MPKVTWGKNISSGIRRSEWLDEFNEAIESRRRKCKPTYQSIADAAQMSRQALCYKLKHGTFTIQEFIDIANFMKFSDVQILKLTKRF